MRLQNGIGPALGPTNPITGSAPSQRRSVRRALASRIAALGRVVLSAVTTLALLIPAMIAASLMAPDQRFFVVWPLAVGFWLAAAIVHEAGHAIAAWSVGWSVHAINVAGISYLPTRRLFAKVALRSGERMGGFVFATPVRPEDWMSSRHVLFVLGGAAANLAIGVLCLAAVLYFGKTDSMPAVLCGAFGLSSIVIALLSLVPVYGVSQSRSDGAQLLGRLLGRRESDFTIAATQLTGMYLDGVPARHWSPALIAHVAADADNADGTAILVNYYMAIGSLAKVLTIIRRHERTHPERMGAMLPHYAFLVALVERDGKKAQAILSRADKNVQPFAYWRAQATILAVNGQWAEARNAAAKAREEGSHLKFAMLDAGDLAFLSGIEEGRELPTAEADALP